jgi:MoaA/NifB/PqqE/SkfB family radical SAM enzyme
VSADNQLLEDSIDHLSQLYLWPHAGCNCRCVMCDIWEDKSRRELTAEDVAHWADEWKDLGLGQITLTGGEALMHSNLWSICDVLRERDIGICLLTTGVTLKKHARKVVEYCNLINVSLDGPPEVHDRVRRVPHAYKLLAEGIAEVRAIDPGFKVCARSAVHRHNYRHLRETVRCARDDLRLNRLSFSGTDVSSEAFNRPAGGLDLLRVDDLVVPRDALPDLEAELEALFVDCADAFDAGFMFETKEQLRQNILEYYRGLHRKGPMPTVRCDVPWASAVVEVDGTVRPCFFLEAYGTLGKDGTFAEIVNSPAAVEYRRNLDVLTNETCQRCVCAQRFPR